MRSPASRAHRHGGASGPDEADAALAKVLAAPAPKLARARVGDDSKAALAEMLAGYGQGRSSGPMAGSDGGQQRGDLARAALLTVALSPGAFRPWVRQIGGIGYPAIYPILKEAPPRPQRNGQLLL